MSTASPTDAVHFEGVSKAYGPTAVLHSLDLIVPAGEKVTLIGPSGSGKTTILRALMTLEAIDDGVIYVEGDPLSHMKRSGVLVPADERHKRSIRSRLGMVFQQFNLFPHMTVLENCIEAPIHVLGLPKDQAVERARELLGMVGLADKIERYPSQLSGGQQQRVAIARALAMRPRIMLFDEITSALDPEVIGEVLAVMRDLRRQQSLTILTVTHQMGFAREFSDRVCFLDKGRILEEGSPDQIFGEPRHQRTQAFLKAVLEGI